MPEPKVHKAECFEDSGISLMARIEGVSSTNISQSDVSAITYSVYDVATPSTALVSASTLTVSNVVFNTLQTDGRWGGIDATGYNFRHDLPASNLPDGGHKYRVEYKFTPASGEAYHLVWEIKAHGLYRS